MTAANPILTPDWLRQRHHDEGMRVADMASLANCTLDTVRRALDRHGIERRDDRAGRFLPTRRVSFDMALAKKLYVEDQMACTDIGVIVGINGCTVLRRLREAGVPIRHHNDTKRGRPSRNKIDLDPAQVVGQYMAPNATTKTVGAAFGVSGQVICRILREAGVPAKPPEIGRYAGSNNPRWRYDLTPDERAARRDMYQQAKWRAKVYERDGYTCQCCGDARGGNLHAHHVLAHATNPADRWKVENGVTLCAPCHRGFHSAYGLTGVNRDMLEAFIEDRRGKPLAA